MKTQGIAIVTTLVPVGARRTREICDLYWTGDRWCRSKAEARLFGNVTAAKNHARSEFGHTSFRYESVTR